MSELKIKGNTYNADVLTGEILGANKSTEQVVTGSGGGGYQFTSGSYGQGVIRDIDIATVNTVKDQLFLKDRDGVEHSIKLVNMDVRCREGHKLSVVSVSKNAKGPSRCLLVYNHDTRDVFYNKLYLYQLMSLRWFHYITPIALALVFLWGFGGEKIFYLYSWGVVPGVFALIVALNALLTPILVRRFTSGPAIQSLLTSLKVA